MIERSIEAARTKRICPYCLGNVNTAMVCMDCQRDALVWKGEVMPDSPVGRLRRAQEAQEANRVAQAAPAEPPAFTVPFTVNFHRLDSRPVGPVEPGLNAFCAMRMVGGMDAWETYKLRSPGSARQFIEKMALHYVPPRAAPAPFAAIEAQVQAETSAVPDPEPAPVKGRRMLDL